MNGFLIRQTRRCPRKTFKTPYFLLLEASQLVFNILGVDLAIRENQLLQGNVKSGTAPIDRIPQDTSPVHPPRPMGLGQIYG